MVCHSPHGLWIVTAHSSLVQLWRDAECHLLFDITYDHSHRKPSIDHNGGSPSDGCGGNGGDQWESVEVYSIMFHLDEVTWNFNFFSKLNLLNFYSI